MSAAAGFLGAVMVAALLGGIAAALADALDILRRQGGGRSGVAVALRAAGATCVFLIGLGGAAVGMVALVLAVGAAG